MESFGDRRASKLSSEARGDRTKLAWRIPLLAEIADERSGPADKCGGW
jgi:hypothetical protein